MGNLDQLPTKPTAAQRHASRRKKDRLKTGLYAIVIALLTAEVNFDLIDRVGYRLRINVNSDHSRAVNKCVQETERLESKR